MDKNLFVSFAPLLRTLTEGELRAEIAQPNKLLIDATEVRGKKLQVAYAPFDHVNTEARIVIVGMTPGRQQMENAILAARQSLRKGDSEPDAMCKAKVFASFSGPMRSNLVAMLDSIGINKALGIATAESLWGADAHLVHFTSILRYPVLVNGKNYNGTPAPLTESFLQKHMTNWFASELAKTPNALVVPLGPVVSKAVNAIALKSRFDQRRILSGLPHPSGLNSERIAFFLGRKRRENLSDKVNPEKLIASRTHLLDKITALSSVSSVS